MKKLLSISVLLMFLGVMLAADSGYALPQKGHTKDAGDEAKRLLDDKSKEGLRDDEKLSVYHGLRDLIENNLFVSGNQLTYDKFVKIRRTARKPGQAERGGSDRALKREWDSFIALGLIDQNGVVIATMTPKILTEIDKRFQSDIKPLKTKEKGKKRGIGLASFDLTEVTNPDEMQQMISIVNQELSKGKTIKADNDLKGRLYEQVIALAENNIIGENALAPEVLKDKIKDIGFNLRLAIATTRNIETDKDGNFVNKDDETYVLKLLETLPIELDEAKDMVKKRIIVFSYIANSDLLAEIEAMTRATGGTLDNLSPATARALVDNI